MRGTFGDGIAEHLMIPYARKIWTVEPREMDFGWIGRRVPTPDVERIVAGRSERRRRAGWCDVALLVPVGGRHRGTSAGAREPRREVQLGRARSSGSTSRRACSRSRRRRAMAFDRMIYTLPLSPSLVGSRTCRPRLRAACAGLAVRGSTASTSASTGRSPTSTGSTSTRTTFRSTGSRSLELQPANVPDGKSSISTESPSPPPPTRARHDGRAHDRGAATAGILRRTTRSSSSTRRRSFPPT